VADPTSTQTGARKLQDFVKDCLVLDAGAFQDRHGDSFLVHHGPIEAIQESTAGPSKTLAMEGKQKRMKGLFLPKGDFWVIPVRRKRKESTLTGFISVGRNEGNDVVVPDQSISLFHALFRKTKDDLMLLRDAGSTNGTFVNGDPVPVQLQGEPVKVVSGDQVRFGAVKFTFLRITEFRKLVRDLSAR
jgi:hypothetical protein